MRTVVLITVLFASTSWTVHSQSFDDRASVDDHASGSEQLQWQGGSLEAARRAPRQWLSLGEARQEALRSDRHVLVYVHAAWCGPCYRLEREVFPALEEEMKGLVRAEVDLTDTPEPGLVSPERRWVRRAGLDTPPALAVLGPDGELVAALRGLPTVDELRLLLSTAGRTVSSTVQAVTETYDQAR